ncbi:glyoxalase [Sphaerisporangium rufum]|uniref:Glyoxalase n=1 Tax=Sphaerisporangium rufum TaxID=1381558 RepID=A0A919R3B3_9ACTN|nr:glyoxalase [Sphaerisporangium rufum]
MVHFEIIGTDPRRLRGYYGELFGWEFDLGGPVAASVSGQGAYGFTEPAAGTDAPGIPGGIGGGTGYGPHVVFYVGVPDVEAALREAERLGGRRAMGPERAPGRDLVVAHFTDPEGNLVGLAGPA